MERSGLTYLEREAAGSDGSAPLLIMLHGFASYESHLFDLVDAFDPIFHVIAPRAPLRIGPGAYRWFYFERTEDGPRILAAEERASVNSLLSFLSEIRRKHPRRQTFAIGHSQGGTMALTALLRKPDLVDALVNINGRVSPNSDDAEMASDRLAGKRLLYLHGTDNPIVPLRLARRSCQRLQELGAIVEYSEHHGIGHGFTQPMIVDCARWLRDRVR